MTPSNKPVVSPAQPGSDSRVGQHLLERIGNTPLIRIERTASEFPNATICAKAEWFNPGGSVKDRAAYSMIREGERRGDLRPGKVILDATSGNTGIAYAMIGAALGYRVKLCLPSSASPERKQILAAYGVEIVSTPGGEGTDGAIRRVREIYARSIFIPINTAIRRIPRRTMPPRRRKSGNRRTARSRISSPGSARAELSSAPRGG